VTQEWAGARFVFFFRSFPVVGVNFPAGLGRRSSFILDRVVGGEERSQSKTAGLCLISHSCLRIIIPLAASLDDMKAGQRLSLGSAGVSGRSQCPGSPR
jgi:hypothetical protein